MAISIENRTKTAKGWRSNYWMILLTVSLGKYAKSAN